VGWWGWGLVAWVVLAGAGAIWLGAAAAAGHMREKAARQHRFEAAAAEHQSWWERAG
jgi:hypothetical protein